MKLTRVRKTLPFFLLSVFVTAASMASFTGEYYVDTPQEELFAVVYAGANHCWKKNVDRFNNAVSVDRNKKGTRVRAIRVHPETGLEGPFITVWIEEKDGRTRVAVKERDTEWNDPKTFTFDVQRWIYGDQTCRKTPVAAEEDEDFHIPSEEEDYPRLTR